ncbi:MAG: tetratricopeptide repeat protein [bacterium]
MASTRRSSGEPAVGSDSSRQLELFDGPHLVRQRAIGQILDAQPDAALRTLAEDDPRHHADEWQALRALAHAVAAALTEIGERPRDPRGALASQSAILSALARDRARLPASAASRLHAALHASALAAASGLRPPFLDDGTPLGWLALEAGDPDRARELLFAARDARPADGRVLGYLGDAFALAGRRAEAAASYRDALYHDPGGIDAAAIRDEGLRELLAEDEGEPDWRLPRACIAGVLPVGSAAMPIAGERPAAIFRALLADGAEPTSALERARLFYLGMVLGGSGASARGSSGVAELGEVRAAMKRASPTLFADYMRWLRARLDLPL